ncbi:BON domain-containing protein [Sulfurivermis fontis]|uniref:BON domain-containing protein n=1 Tax=Sulfurivermis fontis TaxID=1972068 RepID=UPI000FDB0E35|nr:BON domain-containing protein [Sulfurivermis fontis]
MKLLFTIVAVFSLLQGCAPVIVGGAAAGAVAVADDQRTTGTIIDDQGIELKIGKAINDNAELREQTHINITSFNGVVLLSGEAATAAQRDQAEKLAAAVVKVRRVVNDIVIGPISSLASRSRDSWLTTKVKTQLLGDKDVPGNQIKVLTEAQTVYLMGMVTRSQGDRAGEITRNTSGVKRVVKLFEYVEQPTP